MPEPDPEPRAIRAERALGTGHGHAPCIVTRVPTADHGMKLGLWLLLEALSGVALTSIACLVRAEARRKAGLPPVDIPKLRADDRVDRGAVDVLIETDDLAVGDLE